MKLAMTLMIRDAAEVIEANLRYHHAQGVDLFVIADNGSTDGTVDVLRRYERAGLAILERVPGQLTDVWGAARTKIARLAYELGADWVIHNDDDEFWWPLTGNLKEALGAIPDDFGLLVAPRSEYVARPGEGFFADRMTARETRFLRPPKAAHRAHPRVVLAQNASRPDLARRRTDGHVLGAARTAPAGRRPRRAAQPGVDLRAQLPDPDPPLPAP